MEIALALIAVGVTVFLAHLFSVIFEKLRIPDVIPLVLIGIIIGPVTGIATTEQLGKVGPIFASLTLVLILFESGLNIKLSSLKKSIGQASFLGALGFALSAAIVAAMGKFILDFPDSTSLVLGAILGGTAASVAAPILKKLNLDKETQTTLILESVIGNVLTIVVAIALMTAINEDQMKPLAVLAEIVISFTMACIIGGALSYIWCSLLSKVRTLENTKFTTPAFVCIAYGIAELFGFSGMMAALAFGIVLGNAKKLPKSELSAIELEPIASNQEEEALFKELVFLMKTFFFVYLGMSMQWFGVDILYVGIAITIGLLLSRPLLVTIGLARKTQNYSDKTIASIMIPRGLASAVLASVAVSNGIPEGAYLQNVAYTVILLSIMTTAILSFLCESGFLPKLYKPLFSAGNLLRKEKPSTN